MNPNKTSVDSKIAERLDRLSISRIHYKLLIIHGFGWLFDAMDVGILTFVMVALAKEWSLSSSQLGLLGSTGLIGMFLGAAVSGIVADCWGRKKVFQVTLLIFSISTLLCGYAWDLSSMLLFRFMVGLGLGGELPVVSSLLSECIPRGHRGRFIVLLESFWAYGWLVASLIAYLLIPKYGWRIAFFVGAIPALYVWVIRRRLPESPRWLASKGRINEAEYEMSKLENETVRITKTTLFPLAKEISNQYEELQSFSIKMLLSRNYRKRTLMLWTLWFGLVFGYYGIFVWLPTLLVKSGYSMVNSFMYVIIITIAQIPGYFSAAFLIERLGRKFTITMYLSMSAVCAFLFGQATETLMIIIWASLMSFFNLGAWGGVYAYTPELYPTAARATGVGTAAAIGRLGGVLAPFIIGLILPLIGRDGALTLNAAFLLLAAFSVGIFGVETKGMRLEESSR